MPRRRKVRVLVIACSFAAAVAVTGLVAPRLVGECDVCEAATSILLSGTVVGKCSISVLPLPWATDLPISAAGPHRVMIGAVTQSCNGRRSYVVTMSSMNCAAAPAGGKVVQSDTAEHLSYSGEFVNPPSGGSDTDVTGLLATACAGQTGREVDNARISNEVSLVYVNFTGSPTLGAGVYQDIVTISLNMQ